MKLQRPAYDGTADIYRTRYTLLASIQDPANHKRWTEFHDLYAPWIRKYICGAIHELREHEIQEVVSRIFIELAQGKLRYNQTRGSFRALLKKVCKCRGYDELRKRRPREEHWPSPNTQQTDRLERQPDPRTTHDEVLAKLEWTEMVKRMAITETKKRTTLKQFQIFEAHVLQGWPTEKVVATLGVTPNQVYLAKRRICGIFSEELRLADRRLDKPHLPPNDNPKG